MKKVGCCLIALLLAFAVFGCAGDSTKRGGGTYLTNQSVNIGEQTSTSYGSQSAEFNANGKKIAEHEYNYYINNFDKFPISFSYGEKKYNGIGEDFTLAKKTQSESGGKEILTVRFTHTDGFELRLETAFYPDYGAYEWTAYIENTSNINTRVFSAVNACDIKYAGTNPVLKGLMGDQYSNYYPYEYKLLKMNAEFHTTTGRSCEEYMPYMSLETDSGGAMLAIGWPGNWEASFSYSKKQTHITAGQENLATYLKPGESFRTPLIAIVRYGERDEDLATNAWRHWFLDCNMPKPGGKEIDPICAISTSAYTNEMATCTEDILLTAFNTFIKEGIKPDFWWMDAGWYNRSNGDAIQSWMETGTWEMDERRFPTKMKAFSDTVHAQGIKTLLWFEPESIRVDLNALVANHGFNADWALENTAWGGAKLADMANKDFRDWIVARVEKVLSEGNIDHYREDFNTRPNSTWELMDEENRVGLYENRYCVGHLDFWDTLLVHNPELTIDSCASGGNRNDLETMRRAIVLSNSDYGWGVPSYKQSMNYELYKWIPCYGTISCEFSDMYSPTIYNLRSSYASNMNWIYHYNQSEGNYDTLYRALKEWRKINPYFKSDYYPITEFSRNETDWLGWEFFDSTDGAGFVQLFRHKFGESTYVMKLRGLDAGKQYKVIDFDNVNSFTLSGEELMAGVTITLANPESAYTALIEEI